MMRILAIETSTEHCSVALWQDGTLHSLCEQVGQRHSERLLAMLDELLREAGVAKNQLNGIAFGAGPGSFTGVRIACGVAQGLAFGLNLPVLGISTLLAVAQASGAKKVIAALDARMAEVYFAAYQKTSDGWQTACAPSLCAPDLTPALTGSEWHGVGSGFSVHGAALQARYAGQIAQLDAQTFPHATAIAQLAAPLFAAGLGQDAAHALPIYLRDKVALKTCER
jgi:tRNA threonylcarbamoyladenosine biosynthesis protein TsaB